MALKLLCYNNLMIFSKNRMILLFIALIIVVIGLILILSQNKANNSESQKLKIVTTIFPLYDFARIIGEDRADISLLLPPGMETHSFEPKPSDIFKINKSDIFIYTGDFMELWAEDILKGINNKSLKIVVAGEGLDLLQRKDESVNSEEGKGNTDPHVWLDFSNAEKMVGNIALALSDKDPENKTFYIANAEELKKDLENLDVQYRQELSNCKIKTFVHGGHYAFGYLAKRYNLNYLAAQGFAPDGEPTAKDLALLIKQIKEKGISYVFYEELSSPKIAETLSSETGAKLLLLNGAHNITKQDLGNKVFFIDIMKENLINLKTGMGPCLNANN